MSGRTVRAASDRDLVGAIDVGTNTVLLLVARWGSDGGLEVVHDSSITARLGEGLARTGRLSDAGLARGLDALRRHAATLEELGVPRERTRAVGTAVMRRAADAARLVEAARRELGLDVEILPEEDEARLGHAAVVAEGASGRTLVVDVGGGSTELVADGGALRLSVPVGAVVATEALEASAGGVLDLHELWGTLARQFEAFPAGLAEPSDAEVCVLGGTAVNLACLELALPAFDPRVVEGHVIAASSARRHAQALAALGLEARKKFPIEADRAEILPAGLACLAAALERLGAGRARVSGRGLRYGVARELLRGLAQGAEGPPPKGPPV